MPAKTGMVALRAVVTGTGGLGLEVTRALLAAGHKVIIAGRSAEKGQEAVSSLIAGQPGAPVEFLKVDLASLQSIEAFCGAMAARGGPVDILVNNAGIMSPPRRIATEDGFEMQFGVNHLGHFALTARLLPMLLKAAAPRVVSVTSLAMHHGKINFDDLQCENRYRPGVAYCQSKLAQAMFARELQRASDAGGWNLKSFAAHPGFASTNLFSAGTGRTTVMSVLSKHLIAPLIGQSAAEGARPLIHAATAAGVEGGELFGPGGFMEMKGPPKVCRYAKAALDDDTSQRLWDVSCELTGSIFPADNQGTR